MKKVINEALIALNFKKVYEEIRNLKERGTIVGPRGKKGERGDKGDQGIPGLQGPKGDKGEKGDTGERGLQGETGPQGEIGPQGDRGLDGAPGVPGDKGERGDTGPQGEVGPQGIQGPQGQKGDRGDKGDTGPQGDIGPQGIQGPAGEKGDKGDNGEKGDRGETGPQGIAGERGPKGDRGEKGDRGDTGLPGPKGDRGEIGPQGEPGPQGPAGKDAEIPDIEPLIKQAQDRAQGDFNKWRENVNKSLQSIGGGGSYRILDNADVKMSKVSEMSDNDILIWDSDIKKFKKLNIVTVINNIRAELEVQYDKLVDEDGTYTYIGEATPGSDKASAVWRIKRIEEIDGDLEIRLANGSEEFNKVWNDRASFTY